MAEAIYFGPEVSPWKCLNSTSLLRGDEYKFQKIRQIQLGCRLGLYQAMDQRTIPNLELKYGLHMASYGLKNRGAQDV